MAKRTALSKYWPAVLFALSNLAAVALVLKANRSYDPAPTAPSLRPAVTERAASATEPKGFEPLDSVAPSEGGAGYSPLLFDWGSEFDVDKNGRRPSDGLGLFQRLATKLDELRRPSLLPLPDSRTAAVLDAAQMARNGLLRTAGLFGPRSLMPPPYGLNVPPLTPTTPLTSRPSLPEALGIGGPRVLDVTVDPDMFRDQASMAAFVTELTQSLIRSGVQPRVQILRSGGGARLAGRPAAPLPPTLPARPALPPPTATAALPKPPADVVHPAAAPPFRREPITAADSNRSIGDADTASEAPRTARRPAALGPNSPAGHSPAARHSEGPRAIDLPGSADTAGGKGARAAKKPEPVVSIRIQLARFPSQAAAERALTRLKAAGLGGVLAKDTSGGLEYWVVHTKTFTKRSDATKALQQVRQMGYEAWQS